MDKHPCDDPRGEDHGSGTADADGSVPSEARRELARVAGNSWWKLVLTLLTFIFGLLLLRALAKFLTDISPPWLAWVFESPWLIAPAFILAMGICALVVACYERFRD